MTIIIANTQQLFRGVLRKRCFTNMQEIYRTPMPKCDFSKVAVHTRVFFLKVSRCFIFFSIIYITLFPQRFYALNAGNWKIAAIMDKIFETNSIVFMSNSALQEKFNFYFSGVLCYYWFWFWDEDWAVGYNSIKFSDFPDIS